MGMLICYVKVFQSLRRPPSVVMPNISSCLLSFSIMLTGRAKLNLVQST